MDTPGSRDAGIAKFAGKSLALNVPEATELQYRNRCLCRIAGLFTVSVSLRLTKRIKHRRYRHSQFQFQ